MAHVLCVLYDDPVDGYPPAYPRDEVPKIERYFDGQTTPTPEGIDFTPGELLGSVSGELGLRDFLESRGHELVVTSDEVRRALVTRIDADHGARAGRGGRSRQQREHAQEDDPHRFQFDSLRRTPLCSSRL